MNKRLPIALSALVFLAVLLPNVYAGPLVAGAITPASANIVLGQSVTFTSHASGGASPYTYKWYLGTGGNPVCNSANVIGGATSSTYTKTPPNIGTTRYFTYNVIDSGTNSICSGAVLLLTTAPEGLTLTTSNAVVDQGQYFRLTVSNNNSVGTFNVMIYNFSSRYQQSTNFTITSGGSNSILLHSQAPTPYTLASGQSAINYTLIPLVNLQIVNTTPGYNYAFTLNLQNYTSYTANSLQNVFFQYPNGKIIPSELIGNLTKPTSTNNENLHTGETWLLKLNYTVQQATNWTAQNLSLANNYNTPSCSGIDGDVSDPKATHGIMVAPYDYGNIGGPTQAEIRAATNDSTICGVSLLELWITMEPTNGTISYSDFNSKCAPYAAAGLKCNLRLQGVNYGNTNPSFPGYVGTQLNNTAGHNVESACGGGGGVGGLEKLPNYWQPAWYNNYWMFVSNVINHFQGNTTIGYISVGTGVGGEGFPFPTGNATCLTAWTANGYTLKKFQGYQTNTTNYLATLNSTTQLMTIVNDQSNNNTYIDAVEQSAANASVGILQLGFAPDHYISNWFGNTRCTTDLCNSAQIYQGIVPIGFELELSTIPTAGGGLTYLANDLSMMTWIEHTQIFEISQQDLDIAETNSSASCPKANGIGTTTCGAAYHTILNETANVLGRMNYVASGPRNQFTAPFNSSLGILMAFGKTSTNEYGSANGGIGLTNYISQPKFGSCKWDAGSNVLLSYWQFGCLNSLPAGVSNTIGTNIIYTNPIFGISINSKTQGAVNVIYLASPASLGVGNTLLAAMNNTGATTAFGSRFGITGTATSSSGGYSFIMGANQIDDNVKIGVQGTVNVLKNALPSNPSFFGISIDTLSGVTSTTANFSLRFSNLISNTITGNQGTSNIVVGTPNSISPTTLYWLGVGISGPGDQQILNRKGLDHQVYSINSGNGLLQYNYIKDNYTFRAIGIDNGITVPYIINSSTIFVQQNPALQKNGFTESNTTLDPTQRQYLNALVTGGTPPYTYNFLIYNSVSTLVNNALHTGIAATSNGHSFTISSAWGSGTFTANVAVTDSASTPETVTSSITFTVEATPVLTLKTDNVILDDGQKVTYTVTENSGGAGPNFDTELYNITGGIQLGSNKLIVGIGNSNVITTRTVHSVTQGNVFQFNAITTDLGTTTEFTFNTIANSITVNEQPVAGAITPASPTISTGQSTTLTANPSLGTTPYTYTWYTHSGTGNPVCNAANVITGSSSTLSVSPVATNTYTYQIVDAASTPVTVCSAADTVTVVAGPSLSISASNALLDSGQYETFTLTDTAGVGPNFDTELYNITGTTQFGSNKLIVGTGNSNTFTFQTNSVTNGNGFSFNGIATDLGSVPEFTFNSIPSSITVNTVFTLGALTPASPGIDNGQTLTLTSHPSGGTLGYTYAWYTHSGTADPVCNSANSITGSSATFAASPTSTNSYDVKVTDSASTAVVICSSVDTITVNSALATPTITASNTPTVSTGQYETFTGTASGGTPPYTFNYLVFNSITNTILANALYTGVGSTTNTFTWQVPTADGGNTIKANVLVKDSSAAGVQSANSANIATITINSNLGTPGLTITNTIMDNGQYTLFTATLVGAGTQPYSYNYLIVNTITGTLIANELFTSCSLTTNTFLWQPPSTLIGNTFQANVIVKDQIPNTVNSIKTATMSLNTALGTASIAPAGSATLDSGQTVTFSTTTSGGSSTYTYLWTVYNSITLAVMNTTTYSGISSTSNSFIFTVNAVTAGNTLFANVLITDSATTAESSNSIGSGIITSNPTLVAGAITPASPSINAGNPVTLTSHPSGGSTPYTYKWYTHSGSGDPVCNNANIITGTSATLVATPLSTNTYGYKVTDATTSPVSACSSADTVTVAAGMGVPTISPSASQILDAGQKVSFITTVSGGTSSYTYNWYIFNAGTGAAINFTSYSGVGPATNTFLFNANANLVGLTIVANVLVTDSAVTPGSLNSVNSGVISINSLPSLTISPSNVILDGGQYESYTLTASGGTGIFDTQLYNTTGSKHQGANVLILTVGGSNTITFKVSSVTTANTFSFNGVSTDKGTTPLFTFNSVSNSVTVNEQLGVPTISANLIPVNVNQDELFTATIPGAQIGTGPYTYNYQVVNTITGALVANVLYVGVSGTSNSFKWTALPIFLGNTIQANVIVTDSASTSATTNSVKTSSIPVHAASTLSPTLLFFNDCGNEILPYSCMETASITAPANQEVNGTLYLNNVLVGNTVVGGANSVSFTLANSIGQFTWVFNSIATADYKANSISISWNAVAPYVIQNGIASNTQIQRYYPITTHTNQTNSMNSSWIDVFSSTTSLTGDLYAYDVQINSGVTLVSNGFNIYVAIAFILNGNVFTSNTPNGGNGNPAPGTGYATSWGGAGGGGGSNGASFGGAGGSTRVAGGAAGNNAAPGGHGANAIGFTQMNNSFIRQYIYPNAIGYLTGAGGGSSLGGVNMGGNGAFGLYVQGPNYYGTGNILATGGIGVDTGGNDGGGGGGGTLILAYNGIAPAFTYNVFGGSNSLGGTGIAGMGGSGNVYLYQYITQPEGILADANIVTGWNYPVKISAAQYNSTPQLTYSIIKNDGATQVSNVLNLSYIPPANQFTSIYSYTIVETQGANQIMINQTFYPINMVEVLTQPSNTPYYCIQYLPCKIDAITFVVPPTNYLIDGYLNTTTGVNVIKGTGTTTLPLNVRVQYPGFGANMTYQTGLTVNSISVTPWAWVASNTIPGNIDTRKFINISTYDQKTFATQTSNTTATISALINNYTVTGSVAYNFNSVLSNNYYIFGPNSNFINPPANFSGVTLSSTATGFFPGTNNYCPAVVNSSSFVSYAPYLVDLNGSTYRYNISSGYGFWATGNFIQIIAEPGLQLVQQYKINVNPFGQPLENGAAYAFKFLNSKCQVIYTTNFSGLNPININLPLNISNPAPSFPNVTNTCTKIPISANSMNVACSGNDTKGLVTSWVVTLYNVSLNGWTAISSNTISGTRFTQAFNGLNNKSAYQVIVTAVSPVENKASPFQFNTGIPVSSQSPGARAFILLMALLVGLGLSAAAENQGVVSSQHAMSTTLVLEDFIWIVMWFVGVSTFIPFTYIAIVAVGLLILGIQSHRYESGMVP